MKPKATLVTWTKNPVETIYWAFSNMHFPIKGKLKKISPDEKKDFLQMMQVQPHQTVFEFVNTVWLFENVSRAFQQQLTRTREASYSIQSLRIVGSEDLADSEKYCVPDSIARNPEALEIYKHSMELDQNIYKTLLSCKGVKTEDARNVLPLATHSPITMAINFRSLVHMLELRLCGNTQEEYRDIARQMKLEVAKKIDPELANCLRPICENRGYCPSPVYCGRKDMKPKLQFSDMKRWIKG